MRLKVKLIRWSAGFSVVMLNTKTAEKLGVHVNERVSLETLSSKPKKIFAVVDTLGSNKIIKENEIIVSSEIKKTLNLKTRQELEANFATAPKSLRFIIKKLNKKPLTRKEINQIIKDISNNSLSEAEIALFISANYKYEMSMKEIIYMVKAILKSGNKLKLKKKLIADKHSIGGIPGRTTPIVISVCAAAGLIMPKTSSRAITTPAGTADALETLAKVDFSAKQVEKIIKKINACIVWGGTLGMVPADSKIIQVEKKLNIDPESQLLASIMAKKLAVGSNYIVVHIPYGKTAKVNHKKALGLKEKFEKLGRHFRIRLRCILTENYGPLGHGIGPALEMRDVIRILRGENCCYKLKQRSLEISGALLELTRKAKTNQGFELAREILDSGKAFKKFKEILKAQNGKLKLLNPGKFKKDIKAGKSGMIIEINNKKINLIARTAGCPNDKFAGIYLYHHFNDKVKKTEKLLTIYAESHSRLKEALKVYKKNNPIKIK